MPALAARLSLSLEDALALHASMAFYVAVDEAQTAAEMLAEAASLGALVDALTDAQVVVAHFGLYVREDGSWKAAPVDGADCRPSALLSFSQGSTSLHHPVVVPGISSSKVVSGKLNLADADVVALVAHLVDTGSGYRYAGSGTHPLVALDSSRLVVRRWAKRRRK